MAKRLNGDRHGTRWAVVMMGTALAAGPVAMAQTNTEAKTEAKTVAKSAGKTGALTTIDVLAKAPQVATGPGKGYIASQTISATKTATAIIEIPQSIGVVTREQIDDQQPGDINGALRYSAGVLAESQGTTSDFWSNGSETMRGFETELYLDGLENDGYDTFDPYLFDRIEVVGGPASVITGSASPGGIIDLTSKRPTDSARHEVEFGVGTKGHYEGKFDFSGPLNQDGTLLYRLTAVGMTENTQTDYVKHQRVAIAPALTWKPDATTSVTFLTNYSWNPALGEYAPVPAQGTVLPDPYGKVSTSFFMADPSWNKAEQTIWNLGYEAEHQFNEHFSIGQNFRFSNENNTADMVWPDYLDADQRTLYRYTFMRHVNFQSVLVDTHGKIDFGDGPVKSTTLVGIDFKHYDEHWRWGSNFDIPPVDIFNPDYSEDLAGPGSFSTEHYQMSQYGIYAQEQLAVNHWRFLLSGREDIVRGAYSYGGVSGVTYMNPSAFTWRAGAVYLLDNGMAPYFSYATSFKPQAGSTYDNTPYVPTTGSQYELGLKYQPPGFGGYFTGALYDLKEQHVLTTDTAHPEFDIQTGEEESRGAEFSAHANITSSFKIIATYAYTDAKYVKSTETDTGYDGVIGAVQGKTLYAVPYNMASGWGDYTLREGRARGLGFGLGVRYVGWSYGDDVDSFKVPAYTLVDMAAHYDLGAVLPQFEGTKLQINIANLFDKTYVSSCEGVSDGCYFGLRRTATATVTYDW